MQLSPNQKRIVQGALSAFAGGAVGVLAGITLDPQHINVQHLGNTVKLALISGTIGLFKYLLWLCHSPLDSPKPQDSTKSESPTTE